MSIVRIEAEAGPLTQWLHAGVVACRRDVALPETRYVEAALSAMTVPADRKDARGIAQLPRRRWYIPLHAKSVACKDTRGLLVGRKLLQDKFLDVELVIRRTLSGYRFKVGQVSRGRFEGRI